MPLRPDVLYGSGSKSAFYEFLLCEGFTNAYVCSVGER